MLGIRTQDLMFPWPVLLCTVPSPSPKYSLTARANLVSLFPFHFAREEIKLTSKSPGRAAAWAPTPCVDKARFTREQQAHCAVCWPHLTAKPPDPEDPHFPGKAS